MDEPRYLGHVKHPTFDQAEKFHITVHAGRTEAGCRSTQAKRNRSLRCFGLCLPELAWKVQVFSAWINVDPVMFWWGSIGNRTPPKHPSRQPVHNISVSTVKLEGDCDLKSVLDLNLLEY